jgi:WD40 repeat protein
MFSPTNVLSFPGWEPKAWQIKTGIVRILEGHSRGIACIDTSVDGGLLAGGSEDKTVWVCGLGTRKFIASPFKSADWVGTFDTRGCSY